VEATKEETTESKVAAPPSTPASIKSSKKKRSKQTTPPKSAAKKEKELEPITEVIAAAGGDGGVAADVTATPAKSARKTKKKIVSEEDSKVTEQGKVEATKEETTESKVAAPPSTPASIKSSKKKRSKQSMAATEGGNSPAKISAPKSADKSTMSKSALKRVRHSNSEEPASTKKSTKKKRRKESDAGEVVVSSATMSKPTDKSSASPSEEKFPAQTPKASKSSLKRLHKSNPEDAEEKPMDDASLQVPALTKSLKKKKRSKNTMDAEVTESAAGKSSKTEDATSPTKTSKTVKPKMNHSSKKKAKTPKKGDKTPTKKGVSPHKKQQSYKHGRPAVSPTPEKGRPKLSSQVLSRPPTESPKLVMDVKVHRLRFLKLHPKSVMAMCSTPLHLSTGSSDQRPRPPVRLAISREGGAVELVSPQDRWVSVGDVPGVRGREVDALVWICGRGGKEDEKIGSEVAEASSLGPQQSHSVRLVDEQRHLFGCSRDGTIFELDFATKRQKGVIGSGGGGVFCMSSMCSRGKCCCSQGDTGAGSCGGYFAAGCEDGTVKIYSAFGNNGGETASGMPELVATLPSAGNAILSLAWVPGQSGNDDGGMGGSVIFAGVADGTIRRYDCTTAITTGPISTGTVLAPSRGSASISYRWKSTLRMTVENQGLRESTKVWALEALSDGTVVSGDSLGHVQMWDGLSGTMTQTFDHNESGADVLCLAVCEDENKIFASGVDSSVRCIQRQCLPSAVAGDRSPQNVMFDSAPIRNWISSTSHRKHSHDVKALAICHKETSKSSKPIELLVSGSVDTRICTYVAKDFKSSRPKIWYNWPTLSPISVSRKQRLLAVTRDNRIDLFRLNRPAMAHPLKNMNPETRDEAKCLVKTISIQSPFNLSCSVISDDGKFLAASDAVSLYVFSLEVEDEDGMVDVHPTKLSLPWECKHPGTALRFDDRGRLICATSTGPINILQISPVSETDSSDGGSYKVSLEHVFKEHMMDWSASSHHFPIVCLDLSSDGKWLTAGRFSSGKGAVHVFTLPTTEDGRYQHWWSVPKMDAPTTCIKFLGGGSVESSLAVGCSNNEFYIYNLDRRSLSHWSNDMGLPLLKSLPKELTSRSEPVARIVSNPVTPQRFILGSHGYFCAVDLDQPVPERSSMFPPDHLRAKRLQLMNDDDTMMYCAPPGKKSKNNFIGDASTNFTICLRYSEILFQDFIAENEMVIVEEPWMSTLEELPDALARRVYGT